MNDDMNTNNPNMNMGNNVSPMPPPVKKSNAKKGIIWLLVIIIVLALGAAGGYFVGAMNKQQEVDTAKQTARLETLQQTKSDDKTKAKSETPAKTATETTCNADELSLATAPNGESGAGTLSYDIVFTNTGTRTCILGGFPGVSLVNDNGNQIGSPAERIANYPEKTLTLAPNAKVKASVFTTNEDNYSPGVCKDGATKLRVYPPNDTGYLSVVTDTAAWCPGFKISPVVSM